MVGWLTNAALGWLQAFRMYGGYGMCRIHRMGKEVVCDSPVPIRTFLHM